MFKKYNFAGVLKCIVAAVAGVVAAGPVLAAEERMPNVIQAIGAGFEIEGVIPEMRSLLFGLGQPIAYKAEVEPKRGHVVVLGFFEAEFGRPGIRMMDAQIEGGVSTKVDVIESVGWKKPFVVAVEGKDADGDGWMDIAVASHADAQHPAPQLSVLWVFDREDWKKNGMTAEKVMAGVFDGLVHHYVDCGSDASLFPSLSYEKRFAPVRSMTEGLESIAKEHDTIQSVLGKEIAALRKPFAKLEKQFEKKRFSEFARDLNAYSAGLVGLRDQTATKLSEQYQAYYTKPAETRMASPWAGEIHIRQEDNLRIKVGMLPKPASMAHTFHPPYAVRHPFDWIEVATSAAARRESTALGLDYDLGLNRFDYDPLVSRYTYRDGKVSVQVMNRAAVRVAGEGLKLNVSCNVPDLNVEGSFAWRKVVSIHDTPIYAGLVFEGGAADECNGFTVIWADSLKELQVLRDYAADWEGSQRQADAWIATEMETTRLAGNPKLVERAEIEKRTLLSMFHPYGGIYAALDAGYHAVWVRDTTIVALMTALAGNPEYLRDWAPYLIANPTPLEHGGRTYQSFIINPYDGKHVFKEEDDGPFYAIVSAYAYWKLLDDDSQLMQWYHTLKDSMEFLEAHSYKPETGLYAEYLINEAPLKGSPYWKDEKVETMKIDGDWPLHMQSIYLNNLMYASNLMMGEIAKAVGRPEESVRFFERADALALKVDELLWSEERGCYLGGLATMDDGRVLEAPWSYYNIMIDYPWANGGIFPITPDSRRSLASTDNNVQTVNKEKMTGLYFSAAYGHSAAIYSRSARYEKAFELLDYMADYCMQEEWSDELKAVYAMKGSMPEVTHTVKFHRPQTFAAAPVMHAIVSLGASVDFNGINVVPSGHLEKVEGVRFKNGVYDIDLSPVGTLGGIVVDGKAVPGTLKLPSAFHDGGDHKVSLLGGGKGPLLMHSNLELVSVNGATYTVNGYGNGTLRFTGVEGMSVSIADANGSTVDFRQSADETGTYLQVRASGQPLDIAWH